MSRSHCLRSVFFAVAVLLAWTAAGHADPDALSILRDARLAQAGQQRNFTGHLRVESTGSVIPFKLALSGSSIRYEFANKAIILRLGEKSSQLLEAAHGNIKTVSSARDDAPVEGTDITYEDLSLKFLYWTKAKIDGSETVGGMNCWKLHAEPAGQSSAYAVVLLWISKRTGAILEGEGYDATGKLVKRFVFRSAQRDPLGGWMLKQMRIENLSKGDSITYLELDK